jgi:hypothetical protein
MPHGIHRHALVEPDHIAFLLIHFFLAILASLAVKFLGFLR